MQVLEARCVTRNCRHYGWAIIEGMDFLGHSCPAFPKGIPDDIAYGDNPHAEVIRGQVGDTVYERGEDVSQEEDEDV